MRVRALCAIVLALVACSSSGCLVVSLQPYYDEKAPDSNDAIVGRWENAEDKVALVIARAPWSGYSVAVVDAKTTTTVKGWLTHIGDATFMNLTDAGGKDNGPFLIPIHTVYRVQLTPKSMTIAALDFDWFTKAIAARTLNGITWSIDAEKNVVLTSPTAELRSWIGANAAKQGVFGAGATFVKAAAR